MKNLLLGLAAALLLMLSTNCNKKNNGQYNIECINSTFTFSLPIKFLPSYIEEDQLGNILILGHFNDIIKIIKLNPQGELLWQKEYSQLNGKEQGLVFIDENSFFIKTSTQHYEFELGNYYENIWIRNSNYLVETNNYVPTYELGSMQVELQQPNINETHLTKLNADGDILWTKEFAGDVCSGNSFYRINQDNFLFLTSELWGPYWELIEYNGHVDTIDHPCNKNKRTLHKINSEGETIWMTTIDNIFNVTWAPSNGNDFYFQHAVTKNGDRIIVNTLNNTYELNQNGDLISSFQPEFNVQGFWTYYSEKANEGENFIFGRYNQYGVMETVNYLMKYDVASKKAIWKNKIVNFPMQMSAYPDKGFITSRYGTDNYSIEKYNTDGKQLWQQDIPNNSLSNIHAKAACNGGAIVAQYFFELEKLQIIKTNENGEY